MITKERLFQLLDYNPETGEFTWKTSIPGHIQIGRVAGTKNKRNYIIIQIDRKLYRAHSLAWFYIHDEWPKYIDHINRNVSDNRLINLRKCNQSQNKANSKVSRSSKTGVKGVSFHKKTGKYTAQIGVGWKVIYLGVFDTIEEAKKVYDAAAIKYFGEFARAA